MVGCKGECSVAVMASIDEEIAFGCFGECTAEEEARISRVKAEIEEDNALLLREVQEYRNQTIDYEGDWYD